MGEPGEEWDVQDSIEGEFTEGEEKAIIEGAEPIKKKITPKITDVPFEKKEIEAEKKAVTKAGEAERFKKILLDLGFHKKQNGDDKEQYMFKDGNIVIGRTFTEKLPTGKFWALEDNKFLEPEDVKKLKVVQEFYAIRAGKKQLTLGDASTHTEEVETTGKLVPTTKEVAVSPTAVINEAQGMANALYNVVEKQHLYMDIGGKKYLQLEAWQLLGKFCNVHGIVEEVQPVEYFGAKGFEARAVVRDNKGVVIAAAEAVCMDDEDNWKGKPMFQLKSMAQTRSLSKAYRSSLSFIVSIAGYAATPAEEMQGV